MMPIRRLNEVTSRLAGKLALLLSGEAPVFSLEHADRFLCSLKKDFPLREGSRAWVAVRAFLCLQVSAALDTLFVERTSKTMAGWWMEFMGGLPFKMWSPGGDPCWNLFYVRDVERCMTDKPMFRCLLEARYGMASGQRFPTVLPQAFLLRALREIGGKRFEEYRAQDIGGLWLMAFLGFQQNRCVFDGMHASGTYLESNRKILRLRKKPCLHRTDWPQCFNCYFGRDRCVLARHEYPYQYGGCRNGHHGYLVKGDVCLYCLDSGHFGRKGDT